MRIIIFGLDCNAYDELANKLSSACCEWIVDGEGDTYDVKLSDKTKLWFNNTEYPCATNIIHLQYGNKAAELFRADFNFIKIE